MSGYTILTGDDSFQRHLPTMRPSSRTSRTTASPSTHSIVRSDADTDVNMDAPARRTRRHDDAPERMIIDVPADEEVVEETEEEEEVEEPEPVRRRTVTLVNANEPSASTPASASRRRVPSTSSYAPSSSSSAAAQYASSSIAGPSSASASACSGGPSGPSDFTPMHGKGKENIPPPNEGVGAAQGQPQAVPRRSRRVAPRDTDERAEDEQDSPAASPALPAPARQADIPRTRALRRARTTSSVPQLLVDRASPEAISRPSRRMTRASQEREMAQQEVAQQEQEQAEVEAEMEGSRERKRVRRNGSGAGEGNARAGPGPSSSASTSARSSSSLGPTASTSSLGVPAPAPSAAPRGRQALGRSVSYAGPSSSASSRALSTLASSAPVSIPTPTSTRNAPSTTTAPLRRRSSAASSAALSASVAGLGLGLGRKPSGRRRQLSVGSGSVASSVRSEYSPAPPSSPSACSTLSLPAPAPGRNAPASTPRRPPLGKRASTSASSYVLTTPADRHNPTSTDIIMDSPTCDTPPSLSRTSSGDLHLEGLTLGGGMSTPTKRKAGPAHALLSTPTAVPSLVGSSSSPAYDERLLTPQMSGGEALAADVDMPMQDDSMDLDLELGVKQNKHLDGYKALKAVLRCSSASTGETELVGDDDGVVGRAAEKEYLRKYVLGETQGPSPAVYISGPPGTGKTAVVTLLSRSLCTQTADEDWKVAFVNCMGLSSGRAREDLWTRIADAWGIVVPKHSTAERAVEVELQSEGGRRSFLLVLDEVDVLLPQRSSASSTGHVQLFKTFMSLSTSFPSANIKVIAISNSLDLTYRTHIASVLGDEAKPDNLIFRAYEVKDMMQIVKARVGAATARNPTNPVHVDDKAIELVARKVEAQNGDLRMCLSVMVAAVETSEADYKVKLAASVDADRPAAPAKVSLSHVSKAVAAFTKLRAKASGLTGAVASRSSGNTAGSAELNAKIGALSLQVRMVLLAYLVAARRQELFLKPVYATAASASYANAKSSDIISAEGLFPTYAHLLNHPSSPFPPASQPDYMDLIMQLEVLGLFSLDASGSGSPSKSGAKPRKTSKGKEKTIGLLAKKEDLAVALGIASGEGAGVALQDEIRSIWAREEARCIKAMEGRQRSEESARRMAENGCSREELL